MQKWSSLYKAKLVRQIKQLRENGETTSYKQQLNNFKNFPTFDSALIRDNFTVLPIFILSETLEHVPKKPWKEQWKICCCQFANFASAHKKMLWFIHNLQNLIWRVQIPRMMFIFTLEHFTGLSIQGNL